MWRERERERERESEWERTWERERGGQTRERGGALSQSHIERIEELLYCNLKIYALISSHFIGYICKYMIESLFGIYFILLYHT